MRWGLRAALFLTPLAFSISLHEPFETPKAEIVRIAGFGLLAAALARPGRLRPLLRTPLGIAVAVWLAVEAMATLTSIAPLLSVFGQQDQHEGLLTSLGLAGLFVAAALVAGDPAEARASIDAWLAGTCVACGYALLQIAGLDPLRWREGATIAGRLRPFGTMGHANLLGAASAAAAASAVALAVAEARGRAWRIAAAILLATVAMATLSRAAWMAVVAGAAVGAGLAWRAAERRLPARRIVLVASAGLAVLVAVAFAAGLGGSIATRVMWTLSGGSDRGRVEIWRTALAEWRARPWFGQGPDAFILAFPRFQTPEFWRVEWEGLPAHAHSIALHALATRGLLGLASAAGLLVASVAAARAAWASRRERRPLVPAQVAGLVALAVAGGFGALGITGALAAACLGGQLAAASPPASPDPLGGGGSRGRGRKERRRDPAATRAAVVGGAVALATTLFVARELSAWADLATGRFALEAVAGARGAPTAASLEPVADRFRAAMVKLPWDDLAPIQLSGMLVAQAMDSSDPRPLAEEAERIAREGARRVPLRAANHERIAKALAVRAGLGDSAAAVECEAELARAAALAPMDAFMLTEWARAKMGVGRPHEALEIAERAVRLYPDRPLTLTALARVAVATGDTARARQALRRAIAAERR